MSRRIILNGQYVVIQTHPLGRRINYILNTFSLSKARQRLNLENLAHDYTSFGIRMYFCGKLYRVEPDGTRGILSLEQEWHIEPSYWDVHCIRTNDAAVLLCECSYPYFTNMVMDSNSGFEPWSQPITCLVEDHGREIVECPNCTRALFGEDEEEEEDEDNDYIPKTCVGCKNYHGKFYRGKQLICAIHPIGYNKESCPDYIS